MKDLSQDPRIQDLTRKLNSLRGDFHAIEKAFTNHAKSKFAEKLLRDELLDISLDPDHAVKNVVGQLNIRLIPDEPFEYHIQLLVPTKNDNATILWRGVDQIIFVKGSGSLQVRLLQVPEDVDINQFQSEVNLEVIDERELKDGEYISCEGPHKIIEVGRINSAVLIESLTITNTSVDIFWSFNSELRSFIAESSRANISRLYNMLNLTSHFGLPAPARLYETIFAKGDSHLKLKAIQTMLKAKDQLAFNHIQEAIDSRDETLSHGAQLILSRMIDSQREDYLE